MTADPFHAVEGRVEIDRDRYGRPLVIPVGGGKPKPYTRCTTFAGSVEDTTGLAKWMKRTTAYGMARRPDLQLAAAACTPEDKKRLDEIAEQAMEAAQSSAGATVGTALHSITEQIDRGGPPGFVPAEFTSDIDAYRAATAGWEWTHIEQFVVCDDLQVAGTADRFGRYQGRGPLVCLDLKTGSLAFGLGKIAIQLAIYAHGLVYDPATGTRTPLADEVDLRRALVIHLPAGRGTCELVEVDIAAGWEACDLATRVRAWRSRRDLTRPWAAPPAGDVLLERIASAASADALIDLWTATRNGWTDLHRQAASDRQHELAQGEGEVR